MYVCINYISSVSICAIFVSLSKEEKEDRLRLESVFFKIIIARD